MQIELGRDVTSFRPKHRNAVVTLCVGTEYQDVWRAMCRSNWNNYCDRHDLDLIVVNDLIDASERGRQRSPAWQKLLILDQPWARLYDRLVWIDSDIVIGPTAPDLLDSAPDPEFVGICEFGGQMSEAERHIYFERAYKFPVLPSNAANAWATFVETKFNGLALPSAGVPMYNTGVMALSPQHHNDLFLEVYRSDAESRLYEQPHLSYALHASGKAQLVSARFNWSVHEVLMLHGKRKIDPDTVQEDMQSTYSLLVNEMSKAYFLHFCGSMELMRTMYRLGIHRLF